MVLVVLVSVISFTVMTQAPCASCKNNVKNVDPALQCELCGLWEHLSCMRESNKSSEEIYILLYVSHNVMPYGQYVQYVAAKVL